jgi:hypothetical protein
MHVTVLENLQLRQVDEVTTSIDVLREGSLTTGVGVRASRLPSPLYRHLDGPSSICHPFSPVPTTTLFTPSRLPGSSPSPPTSTRLPRSITYRRSSRPALSGTTRSAYLASPFLALPSLSAPQTKAGVEVVGLPDQAAC